MPIFGITASSNMSIKLTDFYQIATTTVGSTAVANVEFTSIPADYTHLQIRAITKDSRGTAPNNVYMQFNADTGTNYSYHGLIGNGSAASSDAGATQSFVIVGIDSTATSTFGAFICDILDYKDTNKYKTTRSILGYDANGSGSVRMWSGNWRNTNAITSIKLYADSGNLSQYSSFALYGIKG
jgi:hypothetical protein